MAEIFSTKKLVDERNTNGTLFQIFCAVLHRLTDADQEALIKAWHNGEVSLQILANGIELPVKAAFDQWDAEVDRMVSQRAEKILGKMFNNLQTHISNLQDRANSILYQNPNYHKLQWAMMDIQRALQKLPVPHSELKELCVQLLDKATTALAPDRESPLPEHKDEDND